MSTARRLRRLVREHPLVVDAVLAALILAFTLSVSGPPAAHGILAPLDGTTLLLCVAGSAALVVRRRFPWWVWGMTTVVGIVGVAAVGGPSRALIPATVAVYTLATLVPLRAALTATVVTPIVPFVIIWLHRDVGPLEAFAYGLGPWCALAAVTGIAVRTQRAVIDSAHERVRLAEESREEEARRRVSEERLRIARDLHDVIAHHIAVINVQAGVASHLMRTDPDQAAAALAHVREAGRVVLEEVPGLLGLLRSPDHTTSALETAPAPRLGDLDALVEQVRHSGLQVTTTSTGTPLDLGTAGELTAYRIAQEALTNAGRHGTGSALLTVVYDAHGCTLEVRNHRSEGASDAHPGGQHGLVGMQERAAATGGELTVGPDGVDEWVVRYRADVRTADRA